tara:strand:- start:450 stop:794 length:345 start_codon:yes stop_codon:yes gene_type:complete
MSKKEFEKRLATGPEYIKNIYYGYEHLFAEDLISVYWYPGWSHIVEGFLRTIERDKGTKIVKIKSHFSHLYVHYYSAGDDYADALDHINYYCVRSCRYCGDLIKLGDKYCEQCV